MKPEPAADHETEARIVAWILGEASAFEATELERLCREQPDLAAFRQHIQRAHDLTLAATRAETPPLRLTSARRGKLLQLLRSPGASTGTRVPAGDAPPVRTLPLRISSLPRTAQQRLLRSASTLLRTYGLAASVVLVVGGFLMLRANLDREFDEPTPPLSAALPDESPAANTRARAAAPSLPQSEFDADAAERFPDRETLSPASDTPVLDEWFDETIIESPFEVTTEADTGYMASTTLAGSRIRTEVGDLGSSAFVPMTQVPADEAPPRAPSFYEYTSPTGDNGGSEKSVRRLGSADFESGPYRQGAAVSESGSAHATLSQPFFPDQPGTNDSAAAAPAARRSRGLVFGAPPSLEARKALVQLAKVEQAPQQVALAGPPSAGEVDSRLEPVSTFSLHVSDVSFRLAQAALARGVMPDAAQVRPEEFYNAFDYGDPAPAAAEKIACRIEQAAHPFLQQRNLVRIALRVPATGRSPTQPLRLTVLLDTSGSMERADRAASVRRALEVLAALLGPDDRVTLIGFARQPRLIAEALPGHEAAKLSVFAAQTPAEGGTNLEAALQLAIAKAHQHADAAAQNRVVVLTDGAANLGNADPEKLRGMIIDARQQGLAFDACGVGTAGIDDTLLEALTRQGDGRYYVLDSPEDADAGFARQLAGAFRPAAQNVKLQVRFNPARVLRYRLVGFEQHRLRPEDFRNDRVDAAELAAEESAVAVYQIEVGPEGIGELGDVYARFRDTSNGAMVERSWTMPFDARARSFDQAPPTLQLAGVAALLADALRGGETGAAVDLARLAPVVHQLRTHYRESKRVQELATMVEEARQLIPQP